MPRKICAVSRGSCTTLPEWWQRVNMYVPGLLSLIVYLHDPRIEIFIDAARIRARSNQAQDRVNIVLVSLHRFTPEVGLTASARPEADQPRFQPRERNASHRYAPTQSPASTLERGQLSTTRSLRKHIPSINKDDLARIHYGVLALHTYQHSLGST